MQIETNLFAQQITAKKVSNFSVRSPKPQSDLANYLMKDPYIFDMMGQTDKMVERDVERQLVSHITKYLLEMGSGFEFDNHIGMQLDVVENKVGIEIRIAHFKMLLLRYKSKATAHFE